MKILNATPIQIKQIKDIFEKPTTNKMEINDYPFGRILPILSGSSNYADVPDYVLGSHWGTGEFDAYSPEGGISLEEVKDVPFKVLKSLQEAFPNVIFKFGD